MTDTCALAIYSIEGGYLFRICGRGTMRESTTVRDFVRPALQEGAGVVIDLSQCNYADSTFCGCLLVLHQLALESSGVLEFYAEESDRARLLRSLRLDRVFAFTKSLPATQSEPIELHVTEVEQSEFCQHLMETHLQLAALGGPAAETFLAIARQLSGEAEGS